MPKKPTQKANNTQAGVSFDPHVLAYIDDLRKTDPLFRRRNRSDVINLIVEEYARVKGTPIDDAAAANA